MTVGLGRAMPSANETLYSMCTTRGFKIRTRSPARLCRSRPARNW